MERRVTLDAKVFLDAAYLIALGQPGDQHHAQALALAEALRVGRTNVVTNRAVLLEVGSALARVRFRPVAIQLIASLESAPSVEVVPLTLEKAIGTTDGTARQSRNQRSAEFIPLLCVSGSNRAVKRNKFRAPVVSRKFAQAA